MEINEINIKKRHSDELIGCYTTEGGYGHFVDLRGAEGEVIRSFLECGENVEVKYEGKNLENNEFYKFNWHIASYQPLVLAIDGEVRPIDKKQLLNRLFDIYAQSTGKKIEDEVRSQETILSEVTGAEHTYIYELLQNANDYPYQGEENDVHVKFVLTAHYLLFLHTGAQFNLRNIIGICSFNQGEKRANKETIGYKGIGFKTVFVNNNYVYLRSGDWQLRFDKAYADEKSYGSSPWTIMPIPTDISELDNELRDALAHVPSCYRVQFAMRHNHNAKENIPQLDKVFSDDQILLFIPHVSEAEVYIGGNRKYDVTKDRDKWVVNSFSYFIPETLKEWVKKNANSGASKIPEKFKDINAISISFAVSKNEDKLVPLQDARVYNYLPTELRLGFGFLLNADFIPNGSRSGLHEVLWNDVVMQECGRKFVEWWAEFLAKEGEWNMESVFSLLPDFSAHNSYLRLFSEGFLEKMIETPCIPVKKNSKYFLCKISDIICDEIGLTRGENPLLTDDEFYSFISGDKYLPHKDIRDNENLNELLAETFVGECEYFDNEGLIALVKNKVFDEWLSNRANNIRFNEFLIENDYLSVVEHLPIFLDAKGELKSMSKLFLDVDRYMDDISFLSDKICRLDSEVRKALSKLDKWNMVKDKFVQFSDYVFAQETMKHFGEIRDRLSNKENNVHLLHFIARSGYAVNIKDIHYPIFTLKGKIIDEYGNLFLINELGTEFERQGWVDNEWLDFIDSAYFEHDAEDMRTFFRNQNVHGVDLKELFKKYLSANDKIAYIAERIKDKAINVSFYSYMAKHFSSYDYKFTPDMRRMLTLFATDGEHEYLTPIGDVVYFKNDYWEEVINYKWLPKELCLILSSCYQMDSYDNVDILSYFKFLSIVAVFTQPTLGNLLKNSEKFLAAVYSKIESKEDSYDFLNYLFVNKNILFKGHEVIDPKFRCIPIKWDGIEEMCSCRDLNGMTYYHTLELDDLYEQKWFSKTAIHVCDSYYSALFDGQERRDFYRQIGFKSFDKIDFFRKHILAVIDKFRDNLMEKEANLAFHQYVYSIHERLSSNDLEKIQQLPIFIESSENEEGMLASFSSDHYLPSESLACLLNEDLVPSDMLDSIHHDYITDENVRKYYCDCLDNSEVDKDQFVFYISNEKNKSEVYDYLLDKNRNVRFWRWAMAAELNPETKAKLAVFPILRKDNEFSSPNGLFLSNDYSDIDIEKIVADFTSSPAFVSGCYLEKKEDNELWIGFFKEIGIWVDTHDVVFHQILPNLDSYYNNFEIVSILSEHEREIRKMLSNDEDTHIRVMLSKLWLLCDDGIYRHPADAYLSGKYSNLESEPLKAIHLPNIVSEKYLVGFEDKPEVAERIKRFLEAVMDCHKRVLSLTALLKVKLLYFLSHQLEYSYEDHIVIIGEMSEYFSKEKEDFKEVVTPTSVKLYDKKHILHPSGELYLGSCYSPDCDFESCDVQSLAYLSEDYRGVVMSSCKNAFFAYLHVRQTFSEDNLPLLTDSKFAKYFWAYYAPKREDSLKMFCNEEHLKMLPCIPSPTGLKRPIELYDYREWQLQRIVSFLPDGTDKLPNIELPKWLGLIGLRSRLSFTDCLNYLRLDINDYRRKPIMDWIVGTRDEVIFRYQHELESYREEAKWYAGSKTWEPLSSLVALQWGNDTLKDSFGSNKYVCNPSFMPESKQDYERLCRILGIRIISNADFQKKKTGMWHKDIQAKAEIKKRLLYLAFKSGGDWKEVYEENARKIDVSDICSCEQIEYFYNANISTQLLSLIEDDDKLWYVGNWDGKMFLNVVAWVKRVFSLKQERSFLEKLFNADFNTYLRTNEIDLPQEFIDFLDESTRLGLKASDDDEIIEWEDDSTHDAFLDPNIVNRESVDVNTEPSTGNIDFNSEKYIENDVDEPNSKDNALIKERKTRSDKGMHHASYKSVSSHMVDDETNEDSKNVDLQQVLQQKWNQKASKELHRPYSSPQQEVHEPNFFSQIQPSTNKGELFEDDDYDYCQSVDGTARTEQNLKRKNTMAQNAADYADEQVQVNQLLNETPKYSYLWFKYLMELMYSNKDSLSTSKIEVDFYRKEMLSYNRILRLEEPSKVLPSWLDNADNLQVMAFNKETSKLLRNVGLIRVDETSVDLLIDSIEDELLSLCNHATMFRLVAVNSNNILDSLQTRFLQLGFANEFNLQENLPSDISFIYGPPGTGKTTRVVELIHDLVKENSESFNILVMTPTNKAADVIAKRLVADDLCYNYLSRFGTTEDARLIEEGVLTTRDTMNMDASPVNIVVTTSARYSYDTVNPNDTPICDYDWDYIIIDEASMIDLVTITYILYKGLGSKFVIAGDPMQIRPVPRNEIEVENIYQMVGISELKNALNNFERYPLEALKTQYRSVPVIGDIVSRFAYNGIVKSYPNRLPQKKLHCQGMQISTINFFPFEVRDFSQLFELGAVGQSSLHLYSAIFTYNVVGYMAKQIFLNSPSEQFSIGIVCPYKAEADAIKQMIESLPIEQANCSVTCGTVHSFQGDECDIMFVVLNPPTTTYSGSHVNNQNIVNVAMSRARDYLFFVIPEGQIDGYHIKNKLGKIVKPEDRSVISCSQMEKVMFGNEHYIEENTEVTCHMPVNVYYNSHSVYDVRWDDNAIDIQIHNNEWNA